MRAAGCYVTRGTVSSYELIYGTSGEVQLGLRHFPTGDMSHLL